jgi:hypothetical protein
MALESKSQKFVYKKDWIGNQNPNFKKTCEELELIYSR